MGSTVIGLGGGNKCTFLCDEAYILCSFFFSLSLFTSRNIVCVCCVITQVCRAVFHDNNWLNLKKYCIGYNIDMCSPIFDSYDQLQKSEMG